MGAKIRPVKYTPANQKRVICTSLKQMRSDHNVTQKFIADRSGLTTQTVINVESNKANPSLTGLLKILEPLGKTLVITDISPSGQK